MAEFPKLIMTNKAIEMIAESQLAGNDLIITKVKIGDGQLADGADIKAMTDVVAARLVAPMTDSKLDGGQVTVNFAISNSELEAGFFAREIGIFAKLGEAGAETLYAYTNAGNLCDWIPDKHTPIDSQIVNATIVVGNASNVVVNVSDKAFVTTKDLESHNTAADAHADIRQAIEDIDVSQDIQKHNTDPDAHANMKAGVPVGTIIATGNINIPDGYLLCDGGVISRTTYSALFAAVKETYGAGDGRTTFALPNLIDRVVQGAATAGIYKEAGLPNITGQFGGWNSTVPTGAFEIVSASQNAQGTFSYGYNVINFNASRSSSIYGNSTTVQPLALQVLYCIKYI